MNHAEQQYLPNASNCAGLDNPDNCAKSPNDHWQVMTCIRACAGDHVAGLLLSQVLYWYPKRRAGQKGVKKSASDWQADLMLSRDQVRRINAVLKRLELVEITKAPWGRFKSDSTFYTPTAKALELVKPQGGKSPMVSKPQGGNPPINRKY
jgi:hypothetical protein